MALFKSKEEKAHIAAGRAFLATIGSPGSSTEPDVVRKVASDLASNADVLALAPKERYALGNEAFDRYAEVVLADDLLNDDEEDALMALGSALGLNQMILQNQHRDVLNRLIVARINDGRIPVEDSPRLMAKKDEVVHMEVPAALMKEVTQREMRAGYGGVSFRVAKGVRFHTGAVRGHSVVTGTELTVADTGLLAISSKRAVFMGTSKTIEFAYPKLVNLELFSDAIRFHVSNRQTAPLFKVDSGEVVGALLNAAVQRLE